MSELFDDLWDEMLWENDHTLDELIDEQTEYLLALALSVEYDRELEPGELRTAQHGGPHAKRHRAKPRGFPRKSKQSKSVKSFQRWERDQLNENLKG